MLMKLSGEEKRRQEAMKRPHCRAADWKCDSKKPCFYSQSNSFQTLLEACEHTQGLKNENQDKIWEFCVLAELSLWLRLVERVVR